MKKNFKGIYAVAVTPFNEDGSFEVDAAKKHMDWLIENGVKGICVLGATGEYQSVTNEEHKEYVKAIVPYIKDRVSVLVGVTRERPDEVIELMNHDKEYGAEAAMILPPFYCHPSQEEIIENFQYIASKSDMPMIVYNNPGSAGVDMTRNTINEILKIKTANILKESTGDIHRLTEAVIDKPSHTTVFCGCDSMAMESFVMGAQGWISMAANFAPKNCLELFEAVTNKELEKAFEIYKKLLPALNMLESVEKPGATIKYILKKYRNINAGHMRRPRIDLTEQEMKQIDQVMDFNSIQ